MPFDFAGIGPEDTGNIMRRRSATYYEIVNDVASLLPPPEQDTPEARHRMLRRAVDEIAGLAPFNSAEATMAMHVVLATQHAQAALQDAIAARDDQKRRDQCIKQHNSLLRQAQGMARTLIAVQKERRTREATDARAAAEAEHFTVATMMEAAPSAARAAHEAAQRQRTAASAAAADDERARALAEEADAYALEDPVRAGALRRNGGPPKFCLWELPRPDLMAAILIGDSKALRAADKTVKPKG